MHKPKHNKYSLQKKQYFSIRKFKFGAASALIGIGLFTSSVALAQEQLQPATQVEVEATVPSNVAGRPTDASFTTQVNSETDKSMSAILTKELPSIQETNGSSEKEGELSKTDKSDSANLLEDSNHIQTTHSLAELSNTVENSVDKPSATKATVANEKETKTTEKVAISEQTGSSNSHIFYKVRYLEQQNDGTVTTLAQTSAKALLLPSNENEAAKKYVSETANLNQTALYGYELTDSTSNVQTILGSELKKTKYIDFYVRRIGSTAVTSIVSTNPEEQLTPKNIKQLGDGVKGNLSLNIGRAYQSINESTAIRPVGVTVQQSKSSAEQQALLNFSYLKQGIEKEISGLPAGLTFNSVTGEIEGTVYQPGQYTVKVTATVDNAIVDTGKFELDINALPKTDQAIFTDHLMRPITVNGAKDAIAISFSYTKTLQNQTTTQAGLPTGLSYNTATTQIEGTPLEPGNYTILSQASRLATKADGSMTASSAITYVTESNLYVTDQVNSGLPVVVPKNIITTGNTYTTTEQTLPSATSNTLARALLSNQPTRFKRSAFRAATTPETTDGVVGTLKLGDLTEASSQYDTAIGYNAKTNVGVSNRGGAIAFGTSTTAKGENTIAIGNTTTAEKDSAIAAGGKADGVGAVNIGYQGSANGNSSVNIGYYAKTEGEYATAIGGQAKAKQTLATAIGSSANADGYNASAIGPGAKAKENLSTAIGGNAQAKELSTAVGANSEASYYNSVALGAQSKTDAPAKSVDSATINGISYSGFAGKVGEEGSQVSIGSKDQERQLKNVAAGEISDTSTDAINGSQLHLITKNSHWVATSGTVGTGTQHPVHETNPGPSDQKVHSGDKLVFRAGDGLNIEQNGNVFTYSLNKRPPSLKIVENSNGTYTVQYVDAFGQISNAEFTIKTIKGEKGDKGDKGDNGLNGKDGVAAFADVKDNGNGTKTITTGSDKNGDGIISDNEKTSVIVNDGAKGDKGDNGLNGKDGVAAFADVKDNGDGTKTITTGSDK
ncbi:collagen-flanked surface repeat-containing protein, partial [Streptococcus thoraltensis]